MTKLYIIATPIGNLEDMTLRAIRVLGEVGALACEDTRHTRILFARHGIPRPRTILSYREQNEDLAGARIIGMLKQGLSVGICSDAGYPGISDSGYRVIVKAIQEGFPVEVIPGAGAIEPALLSSGLPTSSFTFKGFPPRKPGVRRRFLEMDKDLPHTLVFYESPFRLQKLLVDALGVLGRFVAHPLERLGESPVDEAADLLEALFGDRVLQAEGVAERVADRYRARGLLLVAVRELDQVAFCFSIEKSRANHGPS